MSCRDWPGRGLLCGHRRTVPWSSSGPRAGAAPRATRNLLRASALGKRPLLHRQRWLRIREAARKAQAHQVHQVPPALVLPETRQKERAMWQHGTHPRFCPIFARNILVPYLNIKCVCNAGRGKSAQGQSAKKSKRKESSWNKEQPHIKQLVKNPGGS